MALTNFPDKIDVTLGSAWGSSYGLTPGTVLTLNKLNNTNLFYEKTTTNTTVVYFPFHSTSNRFVLSLDDITGPGAGANVIAGPGWSFVGYNILTGHNGDYSPFDVWSAAGGIDVWPDLPGVLDGTFNSPYNPDIFSNMQATPPDSDFDIDIDGTPVQNNGSPYPYGYCPVLGQTCAVFTFVNNLGVDMTNVRLIADRPSRMISIDAPTSVKDSRVDHENVGNYNASTNSPDLDTSPSGIDKGDSYDVSVAGLFFTENVEINDILVAKIDNPIVLDDWIIIKDANVTLPYTLYTSGHTYNLAPILTPGGSVAITICALRTTSNPIPDIYGYIERGLRFTYDAAIEDTIINVSAEFATTHHKFNLNTA